MEKQNLICISCPIGCHLKVIPRTEGGWQITGNQCKRGEVYANKELTSPTRTLTTTVKTDSSEYRRLPVKTHEPIPKEKIFDSMEIINKASIETPIKIGEVIVENILGTGVNVVATKNLI